MCPLAIPEASVKTATASLGMVIIASAVWLNSWRGAQNTNGSNSHLLLSDIILILRTGCCLSPIYISEYRDLRS